MSAEILEKKSIGLQKQINIFHVCPPYPHCNWTPSKIKSLGLCLQKIDFAGEIFARIQTKWRISDYSRPYQTILNYANV